MKTDDLVRTGGQTSEENVDLFVFSVNIPEGGRNTHTQTHTHRCT